MRQAAAPSWPKPPCAKWAALLLNRSQTVPWSGLDLGRLGLSPGAQEALLGELQRGQAYVSATDGTTMPVALT